MNNYILDKEFLLALDNYQHKEKYAKITALTLDEKPIESIEGKVTGGSINIDGASSVRRTCNLTLLAYDTKVTDFYWGLSTKFKLEIGLKNEINQNYPDIIWFKQGIYSIVSFSSSLSGSSYNISISGKDKMCLLNGELGGSFPSSIDLGTEEIVEHIEKEDGTKEKITKIVDMTIPYIIKEMVHMYGREPYYNIIINDLADYGLELMEYRGEDPIYLITYDKEGKKILSLKGTQEVFYEGGTKPITLKQLTELQIQTGKKYLFNTQDNNNFIFTVERYNYGETIGYKLTDLTYTDDLIVNVGDTITSVLDKFVNMLGDYEYFYDLDGHFIFQKKKIYIQTAWSPQVKDSTGVDDFYIDPAVEVSPISYSFQNNYLISSISNSPKLDNIKNDFNIWGVKKSVTGEELDIHMRYAIHTKPTQYTPITVSVDEINNFKSLYPEFTNMQPQVPEEGQQKFPPYIVGENCADWRELIYIMACDYYKYSHLDNFEDKIIQANGSLYPTGHTGYEQYYTDMLGFWRLLYFPTAIKDITDDWKQKQNLAVEKYETIEGIQPKDKIVNLKMKISDIVAIKESLRSEEQKQQLNLLEETLNYALELQNALDTYYLDDEKAKNYGWARAIDQAPESLLFWIDFLDPAGELEKYSISAIGDRTKSKNDKDVKAIYYREVPNFIFYYPGEGADQRISSGYEKVQIQPTMSNLFSLSAQGKSAKNTLDKWLNDHLYGAESISITGIPVYYLEPNTRIKVQNNDINLSGEYIIDKITLPLTYNGTMSISANKTIKMLY